ncbi:MAG: HAD-IA family hydrolase [Chthoniobacteraceae bacterium]
MTRAVFFDAAGTLFHLPRGAGWHYRDVALRHGAVLDEADLNRAFRRAWKDAAAPHETEGARPDDDRDWWRALVERVLDECGNPAMPDRDAYFAELWCEFTRSGVWKLFPETLEVLSALKGRVWLGVVSNFDSRLRAILSELGIAEFFDDVVISSEIGADKPSARIFFSALTRAGVRAADALHVGDDPEADWHGAERAGLRAFRLQRPANSLRGVLDLL